MGGSCSSAGLVVDDFVEENPPIVVADDDKVVDAPPPSFDGPAWPLCLWPADWVVADDSGTKIENVCNLNY